MKMEHIRVLLLLIVGMILALWILANYKFETGVVYLSMGIVSFLMYIYARKIRNAF